MSMTLDIISQSAVIHASAFAINAIGVLIIGSSGSGKSDTCVALLDRGHKIIGDDAVMCSLIGHNIVLSHPNNIGVNFIHIRGIGIININDIYTNQICLSHILHAVVILSSHQQASPNRDHALIDHHFNVLGIMLPCFYFHDHDRRNFSLLIEIVSKLRQFGNNNKRQEWIAMQEQALHNILYT